MSPQPSIRVGEKRKNILYINQGLDKNGIPHFKDMAAEYGLADTSFSTMAAFFDYDNDGDLDMYLVVNEIVNSTTAECVSSTRTRWFFPQQREIVPKRLE